MQTLAKPPVTAATDPQPSCISGVHTPAAQAVRAWQLRNHAGAHTDVLPLETSGVTEHSAEPLSSEESLRLCTSFRHSGWQPRRERILASLNRTAAPPTRIERYCNCGENAWVLRAKDDPNRYRIAADRCHDRWCEPCRQERQRTICQNVARTLTDRKIRQATFTLKSSPAPLSEQLDRIMGAFKNFRADKRIRRMMTGGVAFFEITLNLKTGLWHPHLHVLFAGGFLPYQLAREVWLQCTGDSYIVDVRPIQDARQAASYMAKYASKAVDAPVFNVPDKLDEAVTALAGRRLFNTFGNWTRLKLSRPVADDVEWEPVAPLSAVIARARAGDRDSVVLLNYLRRFDCDEPTDLVPVFGASPPVPPLRHGVNQ